MKYCKQCGFLFTIAILLFVSCKKKKDDPKPIISWKITKVDMRMDSIHKYHYEITYDSLDRVVKVTTIVSGTHPAAYIRNFIYMDTVCIMGYNSSGTYQTDTMTINARGLLTHIKYRTLTYDNEQVILTETHPPMAEMTGTRYIWSDGDLDSTVAYSSTSENTGGSHRQYDTTHTWQQGDALSIDDLLNYGRTIIKCRHLVSGSSPHDEHFGYLFDEYGRISRMVMFAGTPTPIIYDYTY